MFKSPSLLLCLTLFTLAPMAPGDREGTQLAIPDMLVALTFDDGNVSDWKTVAPILKEYGFDATFFITSGWIGRENRLSWADVSKLHAAGFEIACHTVSHPNILQLSSEQVARQISKFDQECVVRGIQKPTSFSYPGGHFDRRILEILKKHGYHAARRGMDPEFPLEDDGGNGRAYVPGEDDPFLIPSTMTRGVGATGEENIVKALSQATAGRIAVLTYHGVPDVNRHCSTSPERFRMDMKHLKEAGATVVSLRTLAQYVDFSKRPADPFAPIVRRLGLGAEGLHCDTSGAIPRFSWQHVTNRWTQEQVAYRILVASSPAQLESDEGDLWDSGKINGDPSSNVPYGGMALAPDTDYWWKIQCWNKRDEAEIAKNSPYQSEEMVTELHKTRPGIFSIAGKFRISGE